MKQLKKRCALIVLMLVMLVQSALPAAAASRWYTYNRCANTTLQFSIGKTATYRLLTQQKGTVYLYNTLKRRCDKTTQAYGTYRVTIVQIRDANGRSVNKKICTNKLWASQNMNIQLAKGTYRVTVRGLGIVTPPKTIFDIFHTLSCWKCAPRWQIP